MGCFAGLVDAGGEAEAPICGAGYSDSRRFGRQCLFDCRHSLEVPGPVLGERVRPSRDSYLSGFSLEPDHPTELFEQLVDKLVVASSNGRVSSMWPADTRRNSVGPSPRCDHLDEDHEHAVIISPSLRATRKPLPSNRDTSRAANAKVTKTTDAYSMPLRISLALGATSSNRSAAAKDGVVTTTASASKLSRAWTRHPLEVGSIAVTGWPRRVRCFTRVWTASTIWPTPLGCVRKDGGGGITLALIEVLGDRGQQARIVRRSSSELWQASLQAQLVWVARIDATEERSDQPVHDLVAEPTANERPHRLV